ncbi:MAG: hypothetical protein K2O66_04880 [Bacteroidales bacterium]|nr:hypothetical protein [Bacteroidales bacterium]MDE7072677.1 hypothetical protein [Bacteroidales bacterium]
MRKIVLWLCGLVFFVVGTTSVARAQSSYIDLTLVSSADYNKAIAIFSHDIFEQAFCITMEDEDRVFEPNLDKALHLFVKLLEDQQSYIIQHEPTYYFVFQYDGERGRYLVLNNSIGEKNEAIYCTSVDEARGEMLKLLQVFYSNTPVFNVSEYRY